MIIRCESCKPHPFQDRTYGANMRVHNPSGGGSGGKDKAKVRRNEASCTVCGTRRPIPHEAQCATSGARA